MLQIIKDLSCGFSNQKRVTTNRLKQTKKGLRLELGCTTLSVSLPHRELSSWSLPGTVGMPCLKQAGISALESTEFSIMNVRISEYKFKRQDRESNPSQVAFVEIPR
jgi:hypothetical protein